MVRADLLGPAGMAVVEGFVEVVQIYVCIQGPYPNLQFTISVIMSLL